MIILIGNKADLEAQRDVTYEEAKQFAEENGEGAGPRGRGLSVKQEVVLTRSLCFLLVQVCCSWKPAPRRKSQTASGSVSVRNAASLLVLVLFPRGENVEEAFLEAAKKIYQNIQDGSLDLNAAESGVQHKPSAPQGGRLNADSQPAKEGCSC